MKWTDKKAQQLRTLWAEGHSTVEIGRHMDVTKNAVIGKARRMGLQPRPSPITGPPIPRQEKRRVIQLLNAGQSHTHIANIMGWGANRDYRIRQIARVYR